MMFNQGLNSHKIVKRLAKALNRLHVCTGWSELLLVAHTTLLEISCRGSIIYFTVNYLIKGISDLIHLTGLESRDINV